MTTIQSYLLGLGVATFYYFHAPFYLWLRKYYPRTAYYLARIEQVAEFAFLALVVTSITHMLGHSNV